MKQSGTADLPLHYGHVPPWLAERMGRLGLAIVEALVMEFGKAEVLRRLSDPFWFQSLGAVMGMDWHSSGITTSVMGALKRKVNPLSKELGIYICGGKGKLSRQTPHELQQIGNITGLNGDELTRCSRLSAKVDNTAMQDGFQIYLHHFIVSNDGHWAVVQQGMNNHSGMARRYHWHSENLSSFVETPHTSIYGQNQGIILNMTDREAQPARQALLEMSGESPGSLLRDIRLILPSHHDVRPEDVDLKRLGAMLWLVHDTQPADFESLLLLEGLGPRTLQSMALVSEVIYGTPTRFRDPARFSFAHGGKDGHPFPVPTRVYDETISQLKQAIHKARLGHTEKKEAFRALSKAAENAEKDFVADENEFENLVEKERRESWKYNGRTVTGKSQPPSDIQLRLFDL